MSNELSLRKKIKQTWSTLSDAELNTYEDGHRDEFLHMVQQKYGLSPEQSEQILSSLEHGKQAAYA